MVSHEEIEKLAYELWEKDFPKKDSSHYWFQAETKLKLKENISNIIRRASAFYGRLNYTSYPRSSAQIRFPINNCFIPRYIVQSKNWRNEGF